MSDSMSLTISGQQIIENMLEGVVITDAAGIIQTANPIFCSITGYTRDEVIGKNPSILKSGRHKPSFYKKMWAAIEKNGHWQGEVINRRKNGEVYTEWLAISAIRGKNGGVTHFMGVFTDITKRKRAQETIRHMAFYDPLTDLPNRSLFLEQLEHAIHAARRENEGLGVMFLDLDRVKLVNDTLGHDIGDKLLIGVANRLKLCLRRQDSVARLGGDEFMLLFQHIHDPEELNHLAEMILQALKPPFYIGEHELYTSGSIGVSYFPLDGTDAKSLLKNADTAMYRAKRRGRNSYQVFNQAMKAEVQQQLALGNGLRRALDRREFVVHYQPQLDLETGEVSGMEALVRWQHPELGLVYPTQFIPWAEDSGLIVPLGELVLEMACAQSKEWRDKGYSNLKVAVNLSATQFRERNLLETIERILKQTKLPADRLELELTEGVVMELAGPAMRVPHELKAMGVSFSIDDFGTGYSSMNYLKRFPVSTLKMDQAFVHDITTNASDAAIATAVIALGHGLHLSVIAEGVETEGQLEYLRHLKCDRIQGNLFSTPLPPKMFEKLLEDRTHLVGQSLFG